MLYLIICFPLSQIILKQMVHASIHMHRNGVFHRDLKCENILIETKNDAPKVRVIDFGCGCLVKEGTYDYYAGECLLLLFVYYCLCSCLLSLCVWFSGTFTKAPAEWFSCKEYKAESTTVWHLGTLLYDILHERSFNTHLYLKRKRRFNVGLSYGTMHNYYCLLCQNRYRFHLTLWLPFCFCRMPGLSKSLPLQRPREAPHIYTTEVSSLAALSQAPV